MDRPRRFRKKPIEIEAIQWTGHNAQAIAEFADMFSALGVEVALGKGESEPHLVIRTLEGDMRADVGSWIIRGAYGELYPCRGDVFADTYEPAPVVGGGSTGGT